MSFSVVSPGIVPQTIKAGESTPLARAIFALMGHGGTESEISAWQGDHGINPTGEIDLATWRALIG